MLVPLPPRGPMPGWLAAVLTFAGLALFVWVVVAVVLTSVG